MAEILKLKAAKASGWLTEEEFVVEVKRVVQEFNGESREPAYAGLEQTVMDTISDEVESPRSSIALTAQDLMPTASMPLPGANGGVGGEIWQRGSCGAASRGSTPPFIVPVRSPVLT